MNLRYGTLAVFCLLLISSLASPTQAAELVDGTWNFSVSNHPASGNNWRITGTPIAGALTAFSGERRTFDSSFFAGGFGIGPLLIGTNASLTPSGNRTGFLFAFSNINGTGFNNGLWIDTSGTFPFSGYFQSP